MTKSDEDRRRDAIRDILLDDVKPKIRNREFFSAETFDATTFVLEDPYAFLIASCLDRGVKSERIWTIPYDLKQTLRALDVVAIADISPRASSTRSSDTCHTSRDTSMTQPRQFSISAE